MLEVHATKSIVVSHVLENGHTENAIVSIDYFLEKTDTPSRFDTRRNQKADTTSVFAALDTKPWEGRSTQKRKLLFCLVKRTSGHRKPWEGRSAQKMNMWIYLVFSRRGPRFSLFYLIEPIFRGLSHNRCWPRDAKSVRGSLSSKRKSLTLQVFLPCRTPKRERVVQLKT